MERSLVHPHRRPLQLFNGFNAFSFASLMTIVIFVVLVMFMTAPTPHAAVGADVPRVRHPVPMPGALREDAMKVTITRDGMIFFGSDQASPENLSTKIQEHLKDRGVERNVYIVADMRARWSDVAPVVDGIRSTGIARITFLVR